MTKLDPEYWSFGDVPGEGMVVMTRAQLETYVMESIEAAIDCLFQAPKNDGFDHGSFYAGPAGLTVDVFVDSVREGVAWSYVIPWERISLWVQNDPVEEAELKRAIARWIEAEKNP